VTPLLAEQIRRRDDVVGLTQAAEQQVAKTAADRVAHEQCSRQHRHSRGHAEHDGDVRAPVIGQAADGDLSGAHSGEYHFTT